MLKSKSPPNLNPSPQSCRAGFLVVTLDAMMSMPGLPRVSFLLAVEAKSASHKASGEARTSYVPNSKPLHRARPIAHSLKGGILG